MRARNAFAALVLTAALGLAGCGYAPNPASGTLICGPGSSCPEGYSCKSNACWKNGDSPGGGGGSGGGGNVSKFLGTWTFVAPSTRMISCSDGSMNTEPWTSDFFVVAAGPSSGTTTGALTADYYCTWSLDLNGAGTATVIRAGQTCTKPDSVNPAMSYTWRGETFTLSPVDGQTATLDASLPYVQAMVTAPVSCTMHFTGTLTKS